MIIIIITGPCRRHGGLALFGNVLSVCLSLSLYIYIYIWREREIHICMYMYIYIYIIHIYMYDMLYDIYRLDLGGTRKH